MAILSPVKCQAKYRLLSYSVHIFVCQIARDGMRLGRPANTPARLCEIDFSSLQQLIFCFFVAMR